MGHNTQLVTRENWLELILIVLLLGVLTVFLNSLRQSNAIVLDRNGLRKQTCIASSFDPGSKACFDAPGKKKVKQK